MDVIKEEILATAKFKNEKFTLYFFRVLAIVIFVSSLSMMFQLGHDDIESSFVLLILFVFTISILLWWASSLFKPENSPQLYITKKHIYGQYLLGKRTFDFPIEKITAVQTQATMINGEYLYLSSGGERVFAIGNILNACELKGVITELISKNREEAQKVEVVNVVTLNHQEKVDEPKTIQTESKTLSSADEIKKFKELFDQDIITEEEFIAKKKQLLGL